MYVRQEGCFNCFYNPDGTCHRYPPTKEEGGWVSHVPTFGSEWCGEWRDRYDPFLTMTRKIDRENYIASNGTCNSVLEGQDENR